MNGPPDSQFSFDIFDQDTDETRFFKREISVRGQQVLELKDELANCRDEKERLETIAVQNVDLAEEIYFTREALNTANDTLTAQKEALHILSITDTLTGAYNRRHLINSLSAYDKSADATYAMLMLDIDHFKKVNDTYGHEAGDTALIAFADLCKNMMPDEGLFGRIGGEEFAILLPEYPNTKAMAFADKLRQSVSEVNLTDGETPFSITVSIGVAECCSGDTSSLEMLRLTDLALYQAKGAGRNCVIVAN